VARNCSLTASQDRTEEDRIEATDPAKAAVLRAHAEMLFRSIPFHEAQEKNVALKRRIFERAVTHPREGDPPDAERLATTAPVE
jgi:hypothetical protein